LICGVAAQFGPAATLTLHSGGVPEYLTSGPEWRRFLARFAAVMYSRIVCVNPEVARAITQLGVSESALEIAPAFFPIEKPAIDMPEAINQWMQRRTPVLSTAMFFRAEYGFEVLLSAMTELKKVHPDIGCIVMGDGEHRAQVQEAIDRVGLGEAMFLSGDLDHEVCLAVMANSDVFIRPTFMDGDAISVREALALGIPVVASNVGTRPKGTVLFEAGNVSELVEQIDMAVRAKPLPLGEGRVRVSGSDHISDPHPRFARPLPAGEARTHD
jgi:glycosyltransferase involved in cell wall biosynthesis